MSEEENEKKSFIKNKFDGFTTYGFMITDLDLKGSELPVYAIIYKFSADKFHSFYGTQQYLSDWAKTSRRNIKNVLASLLKKKLIVKSEEYRNNVKFVSYQAVFPDFAVKKSAENCNNNGNEGMNNVGGFPSGEKISPPGEIIARNNLENIITNISPRETYSYPTSVSKEINVTKEDTHRSLSPSYCENAVTDCSPQQAEEARDFDTFWIAYPKHCGKTEARKAFHKHVRHEDMKELLDGVDKYRRTKQWSESKYIPYPSTFLNQERWKDGVEPDYKNWDEMSEAERGLMEEVLKGVDPNDLR